MRYTVISVFNDTTPDGHVEERTAVATDYTTLAMVERLLAERAKSPTVYERHIVVDTLGRTTTVTGRDTWQDWLRAEA